MGSVFHTTDRVHTARSSPRCRHSAAHVIGVGATFLATVRVNTARSSAVGVGLMLPLLPRLVSPFVPWLG